MHSLDLATAGKVIDILKGLTFLLVSLVSVQSASAVTCYSVGNGNWNNAATWSCGHMPAPGDTVVIQAGHIVTQSNNQTYSGLPIYIHVYGTWNFTGGGSKITLSCGSYIEIHEGGALNPDPSYQGFSETVRICNITYWNTTMGSQNGYVIWPPPPMPMPVDLISFDAIPNELEIQLRWSTGSERDISHFIVQRSSDIYDRTVVGAQPAAGSSTTLQQYAMVDVPGAAGQYYYHLNEVSTDGTSEEIAMAPARFEKRDRTLRCVPNPLTELDAITVDIPDHGKALDVRLVGTEGRWMSPSSVDLDGSLIVIMDGLHLSTGIYTLQVVESGVILGTCRFRLE